MRDDEVAHIAELEAQCEVLRAECERLKRQRDEARHLADAMGRNSNQRPSHAGSPRHGTGPTCSGLRRFASSARTRAWSTARALEMARRDLWTAKENRDAYRERSTGELSDRVRYEIAEEAVRYYERVYDIYALALGYGER